ncbi:mobile element protein [Piscinibacter sakaiensis]|uniref:Mobile element protein n=1 Tax=Piscinibacter sakaiensis TaxID=1547922 RepID=A0A0K8PA82_PISS1|nr:mobile element protein [Piscinibacter sakaiensis]
MSSPASLRRLNRALNPISVQRYKALADIERGFKVLKSEIEIAPVFHRLPERIKAHASICFMALILYRVMRQRLKLALCRFVWNQACHRAAAGLNG